MISKFKKPFFVAEISANHNGSIKLAKELIKISKESGADAVKLQTYEPLDITVNSKKKNFKLNKSIWGSNNLWDLYKKAQTPLSWHKELFDYSKKIGILCFSSPFSVRAVDYLEKLKCPIYKIASFEASHFQLLKCVAKTKKPIIISTGLSSLKEIEESINFLKKNKSGKIYLLYCVSKYPSETSDFNFSNIKILKKKFKLTVGFSDHSTNDVVAYAAVANGAEIIEKHITLNEKSIDGKFSKNISQLKLFIKNLKTIPLLRKNNVKYSLPKNNVNKKFKRSIFAINDIKKNTKIDDKNIAVIRPANGINAKYYFKIIGKTAVKNIKKNMPVKFSDLKLK
jgi:pseudaminic acid synthase